MNKITKFMAKLVQRKFKPTPDEVVSTGIPPMEQPEIVAALIAYKKQNPAKYEAKKAALFAKYGLNVTEDPVVIEQDENDKELEVLQEKVTKVVSKTKDAK